MTMFLVVVGTVFAALWWHGYRLREAASLRQAAYENYETCEDLIGKLLNLAERHPRLGQKSGLAKPMSLVQTLRYAQDNFSLVGNMAENLWPSVSTMRIHIAAGRNELARAKGDVAIIDGALKQLQEMSSIALH